MENLPFAFLCARSFCWWSERIFLFCLDVKIFFFSFSRIFEIFLNEIFEILSNALDIWCCLGRVFWDEFIDWIVELILGWSGDEFWNWRRIYRPFEIIILCVGLLIDDLGIRNRPEEVERASGIVKFGFNVDKSL